MSRVRSARKIGVTITPAARLHAVLLATSVLALAALCFSPAGAVTISWINPAGGPWATATNWDPANVPNAAGEEALFPQGGGTYTTATAASYSLDAVRVLNPQTTLDIGPGLTLRAYLPAGIENHGTIVANGGYLRGKLYNQPSGRILIPSGRTEAFSDTIANDGTILVNPEGGAGNAVLRIDLEGLLLGGAGEVVLQTAGDPTDAQINESSGSLIQGPEHTIRGEGSIYINLPANHGRIVADVNGRVLFMDGAPVSLNTGTLMGTNGGILRIQSSTITQGPTGLLFGDGGAVELFTNARVNGGVLNTANGGRMENSLGAAYLSGVTNLGTYGIVGGALTVLEHSCTNNGTLVVNANLSTVNTVLRIDDEALVLDGTGQVVLQTAGDPADAQINENYGSLIQGPEHTIRGEGAIYVNFPANDGRIVADVNGRVLFLDGAPISLNNGTLMGTNGGILRIQSSTITQGPTGLLLADGGAVELFTNARVNHGTLNTSNGGRMENMIGASYLSGVTNLGAYGIVGGALTILEQSCTNNGTLVVNANQSTATTILRIDDEALVLDGTGEIVLRTAGEPADAQINENYGSLIQGPEHTIRGEGAIHVNFSANEGRIVADVHDRVLLLSGAPIAMNNGTLMGANGGILQIVSSTITQGATGRVSADSGAVELTSNARIDGGTLSTANGGRMENTTGYVYLGGVTNSGTYGIVGGATSVLTDSCTNHGTILVNTNQSAANAVLRIDEQNLLLDGTGEVVLQTSGDPTDAQVSQNYGSLIHGPQHTIRGEGTIYANLPDNQGRIIADVPGRALNLANSEVNHGTWSADGGLLQLTAGNFTNSGLAEAMRGGTLRAQRLPTNYHSGILTGGTWRAGENGTIRFIDGPITTLEANLILDGPNSNVYRDDATTDALAGLNRILYGGRFEVRGGREYTLAQLVDNQGTLVSGAGGILHVPGLQTTQGISVTRVDGRLCCAAPIQFDCGSLEGCGSVETNVRNAFFVRPGSPVGTLTITGDYEQTSNGWLVMEIAGTGANEHDALAIGGEARLGGTLWLEGLDTYEIHEGDAFTVLTFASRVGQFDAVAGCPAPSICFEAFYTDTSVVVVIGAIPASGVEEPSARPAAPPLPTEIRFASIAPAGGPAVLALDLPQPAAVDISVFDLAGRRIAIVHDAETAAGCHLFRWDGRSDGGARLASGVYLARARLRAGGPARSFTARVILLR